MNDFKEKGFGRLPHPEILRVLQNKGFDFSGNNSEGKPIVDGRRLEENIQMLEMEIRGSNGNLDFPDFMMHPMMRFGSRHREDDRGRRKPEDAGKPEGISLEEELIILQAIKAQINPIKELSDLRNGAGLQIQLSTLKNNVWEDSKPAFATLSSLVAMDGTPILYSFKEAPVLSFTPEEFSDGVFSNEKHKVKILSWKPNLSVNPGVLPKP